MMASTSEVMAPQVLSVARPPTQASWGFDGVSILPILRTTAHPLYTRFANIFGASPSEVRPHPR
jgi:hypothetical protein